MDVIGVTDMSRPQTNQCIAVYDIDKCNFIMHLLDNNASVTQLDGAHIINFFIDDKNKSHWGGALKFIRLVMENCGVRPSDLFAENCPTLLNDDNLFRLSLDDNFEVEGSYVEFDEVYEVVTTGQEDKNNVDTAIVVREWLKDSALLKYLLYPELSWLGSNCYQLFITGDYSKLASLLEISKDDICELNNFLSGRGYIQIPDELRYMNRDQGIEYAILPVVSTGIEKLGKIYNDDAVLEFPFCALDGRQIYEMLHNVTADNINRLFAAIGGISTLRKLASQCIWRDNHPVGVKFIDMFSGQQVAVTENVQTFLLMAQNVLDVDFNGYDDNDNDNDNEDTTKLPYVCYNYCGTNSPEDGCAVT